MGFEKVDGQRMVTLTDTPFLGEDCAAVCETSPPLCAMSPLAGLSDEEMLRAMIKSEPWKELLRAVKPEASVIYGYELVSLEMNSSRDYTPRSYIRTDRCPGFK